MCVCMCACFCVCVCQCRGTMCGDLWCHGTAYCSQTAFPCLLANIHVYCARSTSVVPLCPGGSEWGDDDTTCAVCAWTMLADSDMSPVYTLPLVLCALVMCDL